MKLGELASLFAVHRLFGDGETELTGVETDSRSVRPGDLFICLPGHTVDGHQFAEAAADKGAAALVVERRLDSELPQLLVKSSRFAMAVIANHYYGYPSGEMKVIGVTGTNGKTTSTYLIESILSDAEFRSGLMGTIRIKIGKDTVVAENTTQESLQLQQYLRRMRDAGADYCLMEVSSHALALGRTNGVRFRTALFTNLSRDHLDYHGSMEEYRAAKGLLFSRLGNEYAADPSRRQYAVLNADDPVSEIYAGQTSCEVVTYGIEQAADVRASDIRMTSEGTSFTCAAFGVEERIRLRLVGKFNVYNALGAIAASLLEGVPLREIGNSLEKMAGVEGRMEPVAGGQDFLVLVDYSHTPDSLENALTTIREFARGRIITVFGCGGDRDRGKRPVMGGIAARYSDYVFVTSDNPRTEDPDAILRDIAPGLKESGFPEDRYAMVADRREAIRLAVGKAEAGDVLLIAGKGHETYQEIRKVKHHFDDREEALLAIRRLSHD